MNRTIGALALVAVMVGGACSESKTVKPGATVGTTTSTTALPTTAPPTPSTTAAPPTAPPTTTTTLSPQALAENEVRAAWKEIIGLSDACYAGPTTCTAENFAIEPYLSALNTRIANDYVALGRHVEANESDPAYDTIDSIILSDDGQTVTFERCYWSTSIVVQDDPWAIVNDLKTTYRSTVRLSKVGGVWLAYQFRSDGSPVGGRNDCGPRS
jgi:hypothetical protein